MKFTKIGEISSGQDGAVFKNYLFRFDHQGHCFVYDIKKPDQEITHFVLDRSEEIVPHSNSVVFGCEYFDPDDEFPLLYSNIYNNYANTDKPKKGTCLVYRLTRSDLEFKTTLVQMIEVGFTENSDLWCSENHEDIRPYGNFVIDRKNGVYYGFTMRDKTKTTRYFSFKLPKVTDGETDKDLNLKKVTLTPDIILNYFDCPYHYFIQGATFYNGKIYSLEGFTNHPENKPAMRIIDVLEKKQTEYIDFEDYGLTVEPELIDFEDGICYYADNHGNLYTIEF